MAFRRNTHSAQRRHGLTLLEVTLAIALTAVVLGMVGAAINFHLSAVQRRREDIERAQLARALFNRIATDLRGALRFEALDFSSVEQLAGFDSFGDEDEEGEGGETELGEDEEEEEGSSDIASTIAPPTIPGLYGNRYELLVDISHLPQPHELAASTAEIDGWAVDLTSDVKSIAYYVDAGLESTSDAAGRGTLTSDFNARTTARNRSQLIGGLIRRQIDRAAGRWAGESGNYDALENRDEILAPEVRAIEFRYFDGLQWVETWNSEDLGGLPAAVEVSILFASEQELSGLATPQPVSLASEAQNTVAAPIFDTDLIYRMVIRLAAARPITEEQAAEQEEEQEEDEESAEEGQS